MLHSMEGGWGEEKQRCTPREIRRVQRRAKRSPFHVYHAIMAQVLIQNVKRQGARYKFDFTNKKGAL
jgi:hypothetical protein